MPSLVAYGRKWNIASDDFVFPEITEALVRLSWSVLQNVSYWNLLWCLENLAKYLPL